ncbi:unnamed protein product, partial [Allacma fusca]
CIVGNLNGD